jgi:hypothetical protein
MGVGAGVTGGTNGVGSDVATLPARTGELVAGPFDPESTTGTASATLGEELGVAQPGTVAGVVAFAVCGSIVAAAPVCEAGSAATDAGTTKLGHAPKGVIGVAPIPFAFPIATFDDDAGRFRFELVADLPEANEAPLFGTGGAVTPCAIDPDDCSPSLASASAASAAFAAPDILAPAGPTEFR